MRGFAHLATRAAFAGASLASTILATHASGNVVYIPTAILVNSDPNAGIYLDVARSTLATFPLVGYDIRLYATSAFTITFSAPTGTAFVATTPIEPVSALHLGALIGPTSFLTTNGAGPNFQVTGTNYLGLQFINTNTGAVNYGWIELQTTGTTGFPAILRGYAYEDSGASILAGQTLSVPEPATVTLLGLTAAGAISACRWRRRRAA